jgi:hypothetical protein
VVSIITLAGAPYDTECLRATKQRGPQILVGAALPQTVCDVSATVNQFIDAFALTLMAGFLVVISFPNLARHFTGRFRSLSQIVYVVALGVAIVLDVAMWAVLEPLPSGSRFAVGLSWCWIPDDSVIDNPNVATHVQALRFACSYMFIPVFVILGVMCIVRLNVIFARFEGKAKGGGAVVDASNDKAAVRRRLVPQLVWYFTFYSIGGLSRLTSALADNDSLHAIASFTYPLAGAVISLVWAHGEGLLRVLLLGRRARTVLPRRTLRPFSLIVADTYVGAGVNLTADDDVSVRGGVRGGFGDTPQTMSPGASSRRFRADDAF